MSRIRLTERSHLSIFYGDELEATAAGHRACAKSRKREFYQPDRVNNPGSMLALLMDQRDLKVSDLVGIFSSEQAVEDAISGTGHIDRSIADRLGELFHVDRALFGS